MQDARIQHVSEMRENYTYEEYPGDAERYSEYLETAEQLAQGDDCAQNNYR